MFQRSQGTALLQEPPRLLPELRHKHQQRAPAAATPAATTTTTVQPLSEGRLEALLPSSSSLWSLSSSLFGREDASWWHKIYFFLKIHVDTFCNGGQQTSEIEMDIVRIHGLILVINGLMLVWTLLSFSTRKQLRTLSIHRPLKQMCNFCFHLWGISEIMFHSCIKAMYYSKVATLLICLAAVITRLFTFSFLFCLSNIILLWTDIK